MKGQKNNNLCEIANEMVSSKGQDVMTFNLDLITGEKLDLCLIQEDESGLYFCLDSSYVEQSVDYIHSPYGHGVIELLDDEDFIKKANEFKLNKVYSVLEKASAFLVNGVATNDFYIFPGDECGNEDRHVLQVNVRHFNGELKEYIFDIDMFLNCNREDSETEVFLIDYNGDNVRLEPLLGVGCSWLERLC